jgi:hypothetical protein
VCVCDRVSERERERERGREREGEGEGERERGRAELWASVSRAYLAAARGASGASRVRACACVRECVRAGWCALCALVMRGRGARARAQCCQCVSQRAESARCCRLCARSRNSASGAREWVRFERARVCGRASEGGRARAGERGVCERVRRACPTEGSGGALPRVAVAGKGNNARSSVACVPKTMKSTRRELGSRGIWGPVQNTWLAASSNLSRVGRPAPFRTG